MIFSFDGKIDGALILDALKVAGGTAAAIWAYYRFIRQRTHAPHIEFDVSCRFLGPQEGAYVAEYTLGLVNKGLVRQEIRNIKFEVRGIIKDEKLDYREDGKASLSFPYIIDDIDNLISKKFEYIFVEPGILQNVRHFSKVSETFSFVQVRAKFVYTDRVEHSAARVFYVRPTDAQGP